MTKLTFGADKDPPISLCKEIGQRRFRGLAALRGSGFVLGLLTLGGCEAGQPSATAFVATNDGAATVGPEETRMWMTVGEHRLAIALTDNAAARAFAAQLPVTLDMSELNGNEKHAELPGALPTDEHWLGTIHNGDLLLYGSQTLVVFYETFRSSYSYTRVGRVENPSDLAPVLGRRDVRVVFSAN